MLEISKNLNGYINYLIDNNICTQNELELICNINGTSVKTLDKILFAKTGYNSLIQYIQNEDNN